MGEISYEFDGVTYTAEYLVNGNALTVFLPNGEHRTTFLTGGLAPESAAMPHLRSYAHEQARKVKG